MKTLFNGLSIGAFLLGLACLVLILKQERTTPQLAYVDNAQLYNDFKLKKELEARFNHISNQRALIIDSMKVGLDRLSLQLKQTQTEALLKQYRGQLDTYRSKSEEFNEENQSLQSKYNDQVWLQLNQYVRDFGNEKGYVFIFGTSGNGTIMHAQETSNLTNEVLVFANAKYEASL